MKIHGGHKKMKDLKNQIMKKTSLFIFTMLEIKKRVEINKVAFFII